MEDFKLISELDEHSQVSIHLVATHARPFAPPRANAIVNAWCYSHQYKFIERIDKKTGEIPPDDKDIEYLCNQLPRDMRRIIQEATKDFSCQDALQGYFEKECTDRNPDMNSFSTREPCSLVVERFLHVPHKQVLLIQGKAGAGKSTIGMKWAIDKGNKWKAGEQYPIFLYLPTCASVVEYMKGALGHDLRPKDLERFVKNNNFLVLLDGYDEMGQKDNVIEKVFHELQGCTSFKAIITCRSDYLRSDGSSERLFRLPGAAKDTLQVVWLCPLNLSNREQVSQYLDCYLPTRQGERSEQQKEDALEMIPELRYIITTPFCLKVILDMLPRLHSYREKDPYFRMTRHSIYKEYIDEWFDREWIRLKRSEIFQEGRRKAGLNDENYMEWYHHAAQKLCMKMHEKNSSKLCLRTNDEFLTEAPFNFLASQEKNLESQLGSRLLRGCLTSLKRKNEGPLQESLEISFVDQTFRAFFLADSILEHLSTQDNLPAGLTLRNLNKEPEIITEIADVVRGDNYYREKLLDLVLSSRGNDLTKDAITASANAASILVAADVSFSGLNLQGVQIPGSVLRGGVFHKTNFDCADLSNADISHGYFVEAKLEKAAMDGVYLGVEHKSNITSRTIKCSGMHPSNQMLAIGSKDGTVRVWEVETGECRQ
eukprot:761164-Hanusia_phi.AAC.3